MTKKLFAGAMTALVLCAAAPVAAATIDTQGPAPRGSLSGHLGLSEASSTDMNSYATTTGSTGADTSGNVTGFTSANDTDTGAAATDQNPGQLASVMAALSAGDIGTWIWMLLLLALLVVAVTYAYNYSRYNAEYEYDRTR